jgi:hypothetical protein
MTAGNRRHREQWQIPGADSIAIAEVPAVFTLGRQRASAPEYAPVEDECAFLSFSMVSIPI